jgi:hypothetical protein
LLSQRRSAPAQFEEAIMVLVTLLFVTLLGLATIVGLVEACLGAWLAAILDRQAGEPALPARHGR